MFSYMSYSQVLVKFRTYCEYFLAIHCNVLCDTVYIAYNVQYAFYVIRLSMILGVINKR